MAKQTLKDLSAIAKGHKIKYCYEMRKAKLVEILRDMCEEIPDKEPTPKKCPHGRKNYMCKECDGDGIFQHNKQNAYCKIFRDTQICQHNRQKHGCKICRSIHLEQEVNRWIRE